MLPVNGAHVRLCGIALHSAVNSSWRARAIDDPPAAEAPGFAGVFVQSQSVEFPFGYEPIVRPASQPVSSASFGA
jgi:hypothetical protein